MYSIFSDPRQQGARRRQERSDFFPTFSDSLFFDPFSSYPPAAGRRYARQHPGFDYNYNRDENEDEEDEDEEEVYDNPLFPMNPYKARQQRMQRQQQRQQQLHEQQLHEQQQQRLLQEQEARQQLQQEYQRQKQLQEQQRLQQQQQQQQHQHQQVHEQQVHENTKAHPQQQHRGHQGHQQAQHAQPQSPTPGTHGKSKRRGRRHRKRGHQGFVVKDAPSKSGSEPEAEIESESPVEREVEPEEDEAMSDIQSLVEAAFGKGLKHEPSPVSLYPDSIKTSSRRPSSSSLRSTSPSAPVFKSKPVVETEDMTVEESNQKQDHEIETEEGQGAVAEHEQEHEPENENENENEDEDEYEYEEPEMQPDPEVQSRSWEELREIDANLDSLSQELDQILAGQIANKKMILMTEENLTKAMLRIDATESGGEDSIRQQRKRLIAKTEGLLSKVDEFKRRTKTSAYN